MSCSRGGIRFLRIGIIIDAIIIWIIGGAIFGFSLWLLLDFWINEYIKSTVQLQLYRIATYIFVAVGGFLLVISIIGIIAAIKPRVKCLLITYFVCLLLSTILLIGGAVWCFFYRVEIKTEIQNSKILTEILKEEYGKDQTVTKAFDFMQNQLQCCGGVKFDDYKGSAWMKSLKSKDNTIFVENENVVPLSCCMGNQNNTTKSAYCRVYEDNPSTPNVVHTALYKKGCGDALVQMFVDNLVVAAGIAIGILCCLLLGIILTALLFCNMRTVQYQHTDDDVVYEMARCQEKSPYPTRGTGPYANLYNN